MADYSRQLAFIRECNDSDSLRQLIKRAKAEKAVEVEEAAFRKLVSFVPGAEVGTIEHDFWSVINAFEEILKSERGRTTRLARTRQKVARVGVVQTLSDWALGDETEGFRMLIERGMPELTGEAIVIRHSEHFSPEAYTAARERLAGIQQFEA